MSVRTDDTGFAGIRILQDPSAFCYGTDAVLLADMAARGRVREDTRVMDLGCGNGIVPLILAARTLSRHIRGLEVQEEAAALARESVRLNGLEERIGILTGNVRDVRRDGDPALAALKGSFDLVTMNPPYTEGTRGLTGAAEAKTIARHEVLGSLGDFLEAAKYLLRDRGHLYIVHRPARLVDLCEHCRRLSLEPKEMRFVSGKPGEKPNILLLHCVKYGSRELRFLDPIAVRREDGTFTPEMLQAYGTKSY